MLISYPDLSRRFGNVETDRGRSGYEISIMLHHTNGINPLARKKKIEVSAGFWVNISTYVVVSNLFQTITTLISFGLEPVAQM